MDYIDLQGKKVSNITNQDKLLSFLYTNILGRMLLKPLIQPQVSKLAGRYLSSALSKWLIPKFIERNEIDMDIYEECDYSSFNDFFTRKIKPDCRPVPEVHATNKKFFEDIKKYPKAYKLMTKRHDQDSEETVNFFKEGVKQGIFRDDVNFAIINLLVREQIDLLMNTDICKEYSFLEVYESIMFTFLRGISTEKGAHELEVFIREYRKKIISGNSETENK